LKLVLNVTGSLLDDLLPPRLLYLYCIELLLEDGHPPVETIPDLAWV